MRMFLKNERRSDQSGIAIVRLYDDPLTMCLCHDSEEKRTPILLPEIQIWRSRCRDFKRFCGNVVAAVTAAARVVEESVVS